MAQEPVQQVAVPSMDDFNALKAQVDNHETRIVALESGAVLPPDPGPEPSPGATPTGVYISSADESPIIDDQGTKWTLVITEGKGLQIAYQPGTQFAPIIDAPTQFVVALGIDLVDGVRRVCQENDAGNEYWTTGPGDEWTQVGGSNSGGGVPIDPGSVFRVSGGEFYKPDGTPFKGTGSCLWWSMFSNRDGGWNQGDQVIANWDTGAPLLEAFPNTNCLRLACFMDGGGLGGYPTIDEIRQLVEFCTRKKIVLVIDPHDYSGGANWVLSWGDGTLQKAVDFISMQAAAWKDNQYVWFQTQNEPGTPNADEINALYDAVRNTGNMSPVIIGWVTWGYTDRVDHGITARMTNVGIDLHYYPNAAGGDNYNMQDHIDWIANNVGAINATYKSADGEIPVGSLEFGDACCGHVEPAGNVACEAVAKSCFKFWTIWNWCTWWNYTWDHDVINECSEGGGRAINGGLAVHPYMLGV